MDLPNLLLDCIKHERSEDAESTERLLNSLPLSQLERAGYALTHLHITNVRAGIAGRTYVELGPILKDTLAEQAGGSIGLRSGDIVVLQESKQSPQDALTCHGVVSKINANQLTIAIEENDVASAESLWVVKGHLHAMKTTNTVTYQRMESTLRKLAELIEAQSAISHPISGLLLGERQFTNRGLASEVNFNNSSLNASQQHAVRFALQNEIAIIHGPPGTGKTYTLVEIIQQLVAYRGERVLVCGPSNISVDTILERLAKVLPGNQLVRIGHPARLLQSNVVHSLDILCKSGERGMIVRDILNDIDGVIRCIKKTKSSQERRQGWQEVKELRKELRQRERKVVREVLEESKVVVCTLHGSSSKELLSYYNEDNGKNLFDTIIIDEVSQSLEPQCWIPLISHWKSNVKRLILAGDNKQLPPTIKTENNQKVKDTLERTLFDRLESMYGDKFKVLLDTQYRMNENIMKFSSLAMYNGELKADDSVATKVLSDLPGVDHNDDTSTPLIWYDTQGDDFLESSTDNASESFAFLASKHNINEALLVKHHVRQLIDSNVPQSAIGIIAPYTAQVSTLKTIFHESSLEDIEISTVDGFQGREKEVIILSLVRSNDTFEVGFLKEVRRLNVAMTRPKKQLCVIGNIEMLSRSGTRFLRDWGEWSEENSEIRYPDIGDILQD